MKSIRSILLLGAIVALLVGCGGGDSGTADEPSALFETLELTLDGEPGPQAAGLFTASERGYFRDEALGVTIAKPLDPERPIRYLEEKLSDVVVTQMPQVVLAQDEGKPVVAFGSIVREPTAAMIWLPDSGIDGIADLKGKTIAYSGAPAQKELLEVVLKGAGLTLADVELVFGGSVLVQALASGRVDAVFGSWSADGAALEARGLKPVITRLTDLGVPDYEELVLATRRDSFEEDPGLYDRILGGVTRGAAAAADDPEAATDAIVAESRAGLSAKEIEAGVEATAPLLSPTGEIDTGKLEGLVDWMREQGMIEKSPPISSLLVEPGNPGEDGE